MTTKRKITVLEKFLAYLILISFIVGLLSLIKMGLTYLLV